MATRYVLDFGSANAGKTPTFDFYVRLDTLAAITQPTIYELSYGEYYFDEPWTTSGVTSIAFKAVCNGIELSDVLSSTPISAAGSAGAGTSALPDFLTAGTIINRAAVQLGLLGVAASSAPDPWSSTDANIVMMTELLASLGDRIQSMHDWPQNRKMYSFVTVLNQNTYPLPSDFHEMIDQSGWNRSTRMPLAGPASVQEWEYLYSRAPSLLINVVFRLEGGIIDLNPNSTPPSGHTVAFEYISDFWVMSSGQSSPDKAAPTAATDLIYFDGEMMIAGLKLDWLLAKGFDAEMAQRRFDEKLAHCIEKSTGAVTISLDGALRGVDRLIDDRNMPITGFGTP